MKNLRKVDNDILKDWLIFREDSIIESCKDEEKYDICFDEIYKKILDNIPKQNRKFVESKLKLIDNEILKFLVYWEEKYYRNGFCDGINLMVGTLESNK